MEAMEAKENAGLLHTQEVRGSSPCAPTICFQPLQSPKGRLAILPLQMEL